MGTRICFSASALGPETAAQAIGEALAAARDFASSIGLDERAAARLAIVIEEIVSNALRHGMNGGTIACTLTLEETSEGVAIGFDDTGLPFDPTAVGAFTGPDRRTGGGVGLELVRAWTTRLGYARADGHNRLSLILPIGWA